MHAFKSVISPDSPFGDQVHNKYIAVLVLEAVSWGPGGAESGA